MQMKRHALPISMLVCISAIQAFQLNDSSGVGPKLFLSLPLSVIFLNIAILLWLNLAALTLLRKWYLSVTLTTILVTIWSALNYYIIKYHGSPLLFTEFASFKTAMKVIDGYNFTWEAETTEIILLGIICFVIIIVFRLLSSKNSFGNSDSIAISSIVALGTITGLLWLCLFKWEVPKPRNTISWSWKTSVVEYGYLPLIVEDIDHSKNYLHKPEQYDLNDIVMLANSGVGQAPSEYPDIILIINESFYDLSEYMVLDTDVDYLKSFYGIEGAVYGIAAIPNVGGGTNNTEYEVLTGNSMALLARNAPFNYVNMNNDDGNAARYLRSLGYSTAALHCEPGSNYSRNKGYPAMGFENVIMGNENFLCRRYGNRQNLDEDNYTDMIRIGESLGQNPRFLYLLTFQNHGGWEANDESFDTVHVKKDFDDLTDDLNEYLTSIQMAADAFRGLIEYYTDSTRPTIICMLGDHAPSFITSLPPKSEFSEDEIKIYERSVPYVIWANFQMELPEETAFTSAVDIMPMIYKGAGLPMSTYQDYILQLHEKLPLRTSDDRFLDSSGTAGRIEGSKYEKDMMVYYELEYNALHHGEDYQRNLFIRPDEG